MIFFFFFFSVIFCVIIVNDLFKHTHTHTHYYIIYNLECYQFINIPIIWIKSCIV